MISSFNRFIVGFPLVDTLVVLKLCLGCDDIEMVIKCYCFLTWWEMLGENTGNIASLVFIAEVYQVL